MKIATRIGWQRIVGLFVLLGIIIIITEGGCLGLGGKDEDKDTGSSGPLLNAPSNLTATAVSPTQINLFWTDNSNNEDGFKIERRTWGLGGWGAYTPIVTTLADATFYSDASCSPNGRYLYRALAYNTGGNSAYSNEAEARTLPNAPNAPSSLIATTISATQINLIWTDSSDNETGFKIERKITGGTYIQIGTVSAGITSYSNIGLSPATTYYYRVRAYNTGGSTYSPEANATTLPLTPTAPSSLTATVISATQINLVWSDNSTNETGFRIERKTDSEIYTEITTVSAGITSYPNTGLSPATTYYYQVRAYNTGGNSA
ncbi:MAG: fibronectin type III domain-containing protein, partial [Planctomycetota bacterium]|nr:fibronectin type III domain-containing protein [Planctomycetota bacterium]